LKDRSFAAKTSELLFVVQQRRTEEFHRDMLLGLRVAAEKHTPGAALTDLL
jgi:hypothetical protein